MERARVPLRGETGWRALTRNDERTHILRHLRQYPRRTTREIALHVAHDFTMAKTPMRVRVMKRLIELEDVGLVIRDTAPREHLWTAISDEALEADA